jgi:hypothetical protein
LSVAVLLLAELEVVAVVLDEEDEDFPAYDAAAT